ncbi:MAG: hypothetical protein EA377_14075 [Phycisphaerales bacterium]|nr:MAG: hypothetical protein EA377_14075 [Phycisphaerales bacterium]
MTNHAAITLTPAARRWALEHGGAITLRESLRHGCCGGSAHVPVAEIGEPNDPAEYVEEVVDNVRIFLASALTIDGATPITIDLAGLWRWRRLVVTGIEITTAHEKAR